MKNFKRRIVIQHKGRSSLFKVMRKQRRFILLNKAKSIFDPVYTKKELNYLYKYN